MDSSLCFAIDQFIVDPSPENKILVELALSSKPHEVYVSDFVNAIARKIRLESNITPVAIGSYLASRMLLQHFSLKSDLTGCMHKLADSVRRLDSVRVLRWQFILQHHPEYHLSNTAVRAVTQSVRALNAFCSLHADPEMEWERKLLI
jgi:hypothetical protein